MAPIEAEARAYVEAYRDDREGRGFPYLVYALAMLDRLRKESRERDAEISRLRESREPPGIGAAICGKCRYVMKSGGTCFYCAGRADAEKQQPASPFKLRAPPGADVMKRAEARAAAIEEAGVVYDRLWDERANPPSHSAFQHGMLAGMTELITAIRALAAKPGSENG